MKSKIEIRQATENDLDQIAHVSSTTWRETFGPHISKESTDKTIKESRSIEYFTKTFATHKTFVACDNQKVVGYIQYGPVSYDRTTFSDFSENDLKIEQLYVLSDYQSQGIGDSLLKQLITSLDQKFSHRVFLDVWPKTRHVVRLYEKYGFVKVGEIPYLDNGKIAGYDNIMMRDFKKIKK